MRLSLPERHAEWMAACREPYQRFVEARGRCAQTQQELLLGLLHANAETDFGRRHRFSAIRTIDEFRAAVPASDYAGFAPYVDRIAEGHQGVLTSEEPARLHLTSGTAEGSKRLPFTPGLRQGFQNGIQPWLYDLYVRFPALSAGPFYWVMTPAATLPDHRPSRVPVGFAEDGAYLDPVGQRLFPELCLASPELLQAQDADAFYEATWAKLFAHPELSMVSFWSPRFFLEMAGRLPAVAAASLRRLHAAGARERVAEVETILAGGFDAPGLGQRLWPQLAVVSCWTDGWASLFVEDIRRFFGDVPLQGKGLLATEGIVSFPFGTGAGSVVAVRSHFFEFEAASGDCFLAHQVREGEEYQVLLTTQGGLYRYRLGDIVRVVGWETDIPRLVFVSRSGRTVDLCGEKLEEAHVTRVVSERLQRRAARPSVCFLAPAVERSSTGYVLVLDDASRIDHTALASDIESGLEENIYYKHGRRLGQLAPLRVMTLNPSQADGYRALKDKGQPSTAKPVFLETDPKVLEIFAFL